MIAREITTAFMLATPLFVACPAQALNTSWCGEEGMMFLPEDPESTYLGFNDHTICTADFPLLPALEEAGLWQGELNCLNVYVTAVHDDGTVETEEAEHRIIRLTVTLEGAMATVTRPDGAVASYRDCGY